jgi:hypothetical protein
MYSIPRELTPNINLNSQFHPITISPRLNWQHLPPLPDPDGGNLGNGLGSGLGSGGFHLPLVPREATQPINQSDYSWKSEHTVYVLLNQDMNTRHKFVWST